MSREVLQAARAAFIEDQEDYVEHVHRVALVFYLEVWEAYFLIEEGGPAVG